MRRKRKCRKCIRGKGLVGLEGKYYTPIQKLEAMMLRRKLRRLVIRGKKRIKGKGIKSFNKKMQNRGTNHKAPWFIYRAM